MGHDLRPGDIVQIDPSTRNRDLHGWEGCLVVVSEVKSWGVAAYARTPGLDGFAHIRLANRDDYEPVAARAVWLEDGL